MLSIFFSSDFSDSEDENPLVVPAPITTKPKDDTNDDDNDGKRYIKTCAFSQSAY